MKKLLFWGCVVSVFMLAVAVVVVRQVSPETFHVCKEYVMNRLRGYDWSMAVDARTVQLDGIDVSHHNGKINWRKVAENENIKFVYIKATEGATHRDSRFKVNAKEARKAGLEVGAYHYLTCKTSVEAQFKNFQKTVAGLDLTLIPMVDVESSGMTDNNHRELSPAEISKLLKAFCRLVEEHYGRKPVIYASSYYFRKALSNDFADYYLWANGYYGKPYIGQKGRAGIWQFTEHGHLDGIPNPVDLNRFQNGMTVEKLKMNSQKGTKDR